MPRLAFYKVPHFPQSCQNLASTQLQLAKGAYIICTKLALFSSSFLVQVRMKLVTHTHKYKFSLIRFCNCMGDIVVRNPTEVHIIPHGSLTRDLLPVTVMAANAAGHRTEAVSVWWAYCNALSPSPTVVESRDKSPFIYTVAGAKGQ